MLIKFKKPDPRAGSIARMDSHRGQQLVDAGAADRLKEDGTDDLPEQSKAPSPPTAKASEGLNVDELKAALTEKGIAIPASAKKAELAELLDKAA